MMEEEQVDWGVEEEITVSARFAVTAVESAGDYDDEDAVSLAPSDEDDDQPYAHQLPPATQDHAHPVSRTLSQHSMRTAEDAEQEDANGYSSFEDRGRSAPRSPADADMPSGRSPPPQTSQPTPPAFMMHRLPPKPQTSPSTYPRHLRPPTASDHFSEPPNRSSPTTRNVSDRRFNDPQQHTSSSRPHDPNDLPPGWEKRVSSGPPRAVYYYHRESDRTQWEHPLEDQFSQLNDHDVSNDDQRRLSTSQPPEKRIEPELIQSSLSYEDRHYRPQERSGADPQPQYDEPPSRSSYNGGYQGSRGVSEDSGRDSNKGRFHPREEVANQSYVAPRGRFPNKTSSFEPAPQKIREGDWVKEPEHTQRGRHSWDHPSRGLRNDERADRYGYDRKDGGSTVHNARSTTRPSVMPSTMSQRNRSPAPQNQALNYHTRPRRNSFSTTGTSHRPAADYRPPHVQDDNYRRSSYQGAAPFEESRRPHGHNGGYNPSETNSLRRPRDSEPVYDIDPKRRRHNPTSTSQRPRHDRFNNGDARENYQRSQSQSASSVPLSYPSGPFSSHQNRPQDSHYNVTRGYNGPTQGSRGPRNTSPYNTLRPPKEGPGRFSQGPMDVDYGHDQSSLPSARSDFGSPTGSGQDEYQPPEYRQSARDPHHPMQPDISKAPRPPLHHRISGIASPQPPPDEPRRPPPDSNHNPYNNGLHRPNTTGARLSRDTNTRYQDWRPEPEPVHQPNNDSHWRPSGVFVGHELHPGTSPNLALEPPNTENRRRVRPSRFDQGNPSLNTNENLATHPKPAPYYEGEPAYKNGSLEERMPRDQPLNSRPHGNFAHSGSRRRASSFSAPGTSGLIGRIGDRMPQDVGGNNSSPQPPYGHGTALPTRNVSRSPDTTRVQSHPPAGPPHSDTPPPPAPIMDRSPSVATESRETTAEDAMGTRPPRHRRGNSFGAQHQAPMLREKQEVSYRSPSTEFKGYDNVPPSSGHWRSSINNGANLNRHGGGPLINRLSLEQRQEPLLSPRTTEPFNQRPGGLGVTLEPGPQNREPSSWTRSPYPETVTSEANRGYHNRGTYSRRGGGRGRGRYSDARAYGENGGRY